MSWLIPPWQPNQLFQLRRAKCFSRLTLMMHIEVPYGCGEGLHSDERTEHPPPKAVTGFARDGGGNATICRWEFAVSIPKAAALRPHSP